MRKIFKIFLPILPFTLVAANLFGQTTGHTLVKIDTSSSSTEFRWAASNHSAAAGNFFIYEVIPDGTVFQFIRTEGFSVPTFGSKPTLPLAGPANLLIGPFSIAANASVTFRVSETRSRGGLRLHNGLLSGETFVLLSQGQLTGKNNSLSADAESLLEKSGTPQPFETAGRGLVGSIAAVPNVSRNGQPIAFRVTLDSPGLVGLSLYTLTGEKVYSAQAQGNTGLNSLVWNLQNSAGQPVASGLYLYLVEVSAEGSKQSRVGKVVVVR